MNQKTMKQLVRHASEAGKDLEALKRVWYETPRNKRNKLRQEILGKVEKVSNKKVKPTRPIEKKSKVKDKVKTQTKAKSKPIPKAS